MSLTSLLKLPNVRTRFKEDWPLPMPRPTTKNWLMLAPPISARPAMLGTAFDYVFRFYLHRINPISESRSWIAESALHRMKGSMRDVGLEICATARVRHHEFLSGSPINDDLLVSTILLAQLDGVFRSGGMLPSSGEFTVKPEDLDDLKQLVKSCDWTQWRSSNLCLLNPGFGWASSLVFGADADFQIDEILYELKTVRQVGSLTENYHQLVGYSALNYLNCGPKITNLAVYFSRFARTVLWSAPNWEDVRYEPFLLWFCRTIEERIGSFGLHLSGLLEGAPQELPLRSQLEALVVELQHCQQETEKAYFTQFEVKSGRTRLKQQ